MHRPKQVALISNESYGVYRAFLLNRVSGSGEVDKCSTLNLLQLHLNLNTLFSKKALRGLQGFLTEQGVQVQARWTNVLL
jgi:hypothetical protein